MKFIERVGKNLQATFMYVPVWHFPFHSNNFWVHMYLKFKLIKGRFSLNRLKYSFLFSLIFFRVSVWVIYALIFTFIPSLFMLRSSVCILVLFKIYLKIMCFFRWWWKRVIHSIWIFLLVFRLLCAIRLNRWRKFD